jgi:hypothetical protein
MRRAQNGGLAVRDQHGGIGLAGNAPGLHDERPAAPLYFFSCDLKHLLLLPFQQPRPAYPSWIADLSGYTPDP